MSNETPQESVEDVIANVNAEFNKLDSKVESKPVAEPEQDYTTEVGEYKGNKVLTIFKGEKRVFGFGLKKAQAILACIEAIKQFTQEES